MTRKMKDSGIEWIGEIPEEWIFSRIDSLYYERNTKVSDKDYEALSVTKKGILPQLDSAAKTDNGDNRKLVKIGDFVINSRSDRRGSCGISTYNGSVSLINTVILPRSNVCNEYFNLVFRTERFADEYYRWGNGIVDDLWSTKWSSFKRINICIPQLNEQYAIVNYLDRKCNLIDKAIERQKLVIEKLKLYKQSIITEAVTKGLDPTVKMKPSGIEWIGEIPERWKVIKGKYIFDIFGVQVSEYFDNDFLEVPYYKVDSLNRVKDNFYISEEPEKLRVCTKEKLIIAPVILIPKRGAAIYTNKVRIIEIDCFFDSNIMALKPKKDNIKYLAYMIFGRKLTDIGDVSTIPQINNKHIYVLDIPLPPLSEQQVISDYLDIKCSAIDNAINNKQKLIDKLTDYKKSLIYECVTGKRECNS